MIKRSIILACALLLGAAFTAPVCGEQEKSATSSRERYKVVTENNIFLRDRSRPSRKEPAFTTPVSPPERRFVVTGTVLQSETHIAFLEDTRTGTTSRVRAGETVGEGRIVQIAMDGLVYEKDKITLKINLGKSLDGASTKPSSASSDSSAKTGAAPAAELNASDQRAILERLRQRREKELKKQ